MRRITDDPVISIRGVIEAYRDYDASEEAKETILYFVSDLVALSIDTILQALDETEK